MQEIRLFAAEFEELMELARKLEDAPATVREARREAIAQAGEELEALVLRTIGGSGKVKSWQGLYLGSGGGYAAVRAKAGFYTEPLTISRIIKRVLFGRKLTRYPVGYVTNAIENGHSFPGRRGSGPQVPGRHFYREAGAQVPEYAQRAAEDIMQRLRAHLED